MAMPSGTVPPLLTTAEQINTLPRWPIDALGSEPFPDAVSAHQVADEPGEQVIVLSNLREKAVEDAMPAA